VPKFKDEGSEGSTRTQRRRLPKAEDMGAREEEDIRVAKYYHSTGNYLGAYMRAKDAIKIDPEDPEAHYALAINAEKLSKKDEARDGYTVYLKLEPDGRDAKAAKQALADLR
jgi:Tfp pilus assembly protein PilF